MLHDPYLPDVAQSLQARSAMLADSVSDLADSPPLIALTVGRQLVVDLGPKRAHHIAQGILDEVGRASEQQHRNAFAAEVAYAGKDDALDATPVVFWLIAAAVLVVAVMFLLLGRAAAAEAIVQRDLYRALGDAAPAYRVLP